MLPVNGVITRSAPWRYSGDLDACALTGESGNKAPTTISPAIKRSPRTAPVATPMAPPTVALAHWDADGCSGLRIASPSRTFRSGSAIRFSNPLMELYAMTNRMAPRISEKSRRLVMKV
ncbi:hypothetical protein D3C75_1108400 [compost metagenome]